MLSSTPSTWELRYLDSEGPPGGKVALHVDAAADDQWHTATATVTDLPVGATLELTRTTAAAAELGQTSTFIFHTIEVVRA